MEKRKISQEELKDILEKHEKWLYEVPNGECVDLSDTDLTGVDLTGVDLTGVDLRNADLKNADLRNADLRNADLSDTDLTDVDLRDANLRGANLRSADLKNADLRNATIWNSSFPNVFNKTIISIQLDTSVRNRVINYIPDIDWVSAGCFHGTLEELKNRVKDFYSDNEKIRKRYEKAIELIEFLKEDTPNDK